MSSGHFFFGYILPCLMMGFGIAVDVTIATLSKFRDETLTFKTWTLPITVTHVMFPATGYYLFWGLAEVFPALELLLGIAGFALVALFVYEVICKSVGTTPVFGISDWISALFGFDESDSRRFIAILAVSWDALLSGPAKAAQAAAGHWTTNEVFISFFIAGAAVAAIAQMALIGAFWLRKIRFADTEAMAHFNFWAKFVELSVIGGFGVLSLWQGVIGDGDLYWSIAITAVLLGIVFFWFRAELFIHEFDEAVEAIAD